VIHALRNKSFKSEGVYTVHVQAKNEECIES